MQSVGVSRRTLLRTAAQLGLLTTCGLERSFGQIPAITLQAKTVAAFQAYAHEVETRQLEPQWRSNHFLRVDNDPALRAEVLHGEISISEGTDDNPVEISDGLVHDWLGDVFFPGVSMRRVLDVLQDFDKHAGMYPEITRSRLLSKSGESVTGYWRLEKKEQMIPVVLDVIDKATYEQIAPGKWVSHAYADDIAEVENAGQQNEKKLRPGHGQGFLWRLYAYWSLEALNEGVLAECRTLSLSRGIPIGLGWAIKPIVKNLPRESLSATLRETRNVLSAHSA